MCEGVSEKPMCNLSPCLEIHTKGLGQNIDIAVDYFERVFKTLHASVHPLWHIQV